METLPEHYSSGFCWGEHRYLETTDKEHWTTLHLQGIGTETTVTLERDDQSGGYCYPSLTSRAEGCKRFTPEEPWEIYLLLHAYISQREDSQNRFCGAFCTNYCGTVVRSPLQRLAISSSLGSLYLTQVGQILHSDKINTSSFSWYICI